MMKEAFEERMVTLRSDPNTRAVIDYITGSSSGHRSETLAANSMSLVPSAHLIGRVSDDIVPTNTLKTEKRS